MQKLAGSSTAPRYGEIFTKESLYTDNNDSFLGDLGKLSNNSTQWPHPPIPGTESDSESYRSAALKYFGR